MVYKPFLPSAPSEANSIPDISALPNYIATTHILNIDAPWPQSIVVGFLIQPYLDMSASDNALHLPV